METLWQDLRYGWRSLRKQPGFSAIAVLTLALGIGCNTAIFSLINALFFRPPAVVEDPDRLVGVFGFREGRPQALSYPDYLDYRNRNTVFSDLASQGTIWMYLVSGGDSVEVYGYAVSSNYFTVLGVKPLLGRFFLPEEDAAPGRYPVAVLSYHLWHRQFGGDRGILGKTIQMNQTAFTVVGIAPKEFRGIYAGSEEEIWIPSMMASPGTNSTVSAATAAAVFNRSNTWLNVIGRLKTGRTAAEAGAELTTLASQRETAYRETHKGLGVYLAPVRGIYPHPQSMESEAKVSSLLAAAVNFLLLIACANLAGLLLARGSARRKEIAVRLSIGASRARLLRQLLTESMLLSLLGGAAGLIIASFATDLISAFYTYGLAGLVIPMDPLVLGYTLALSVVTGLVFGLAPALQATRIELFPILKDEGSTSGFRQSRIRAALVVAQVALSLVLLVGASLLLMSLGGVIANPGYDSVHFAHFRLRPSRIGYDSSRAQTYYRELIRRLEALPGVQSAILGKVTPNAAWGYLLAVFLPGQRPARPEDALQIDSNDVTPGFFESLRIPLIKGRAFDERDRNGAPLVAIVNETLARRLWPDREPLGMSLFVDGKEHSVIGVTKDAIPRKSNESPKPYLYRVYWQTDGVDSRLFVRVARDPQRMVPVLRRELVAVDPNIHIGQDMLLSERRKMEYQSERLVGSFLICAGILALFLSAIGLYGALAYAVSQRTREIGIRLALGAQREEILKMVVKQGLTLALLGITIGLGAASAVTRFLASFLYGISARDPIAFIGISLLLMVVALVSCYIPARRAMKVDPIVALRYE